MLLSFTGRDTNLFSELLHALNWFQTFNYWLILPPCFFLLQLIISGILSLKQTCKDNGDDDEGSCVGGGDSVCKYRH